MRRRLVRMSPVKIASKSRCGILAAGNFIVDRVAMIDRYPQQDACVSISGTTLSNGGAPFNALCDWARLGVKFPLYAAGLIGRDPEGDFITQILRDSGVDISRMKRHPKARTSYSEILTETSSGRRTIFHHQGASAFVGPDCLDMSPGRRGDPGAKIFLLAFIALLTRMDRPDRRFGTVGARTLATARAQGYVTAADVVTDLSGRLPELVDAALPHLDFFFCNELEASTLTGLQMRSRKGKLDPIALEKAAGILARRGDRSTVVIHAAEGALAFAPQGVPYFQGSVNMPSRLIVGTNGAGDAFLAGFLAGVHDGAPPAQCLRLGVCVAAASLTDGTPSAGVRALRACLALGKRHGFRSDLL